MKKKDKLNDLCKLLWTYCDICDEKIEGEENYKPRNNPCFDKDKILDHLFYSGGAGVKGETDNHYSVMMEIVDKEKFEEMFFEVWKTGDIKILKRCAKYLLNRGIVAYWDPCEDERMDKLPWWAWVPAIIMSVLALGINLWNILR